MSAKRISVRQTGPNSFAVIGTDGRIIHDSFPTLQVAWMWAAKRGLHQGRNKRKREAITAPADLENERILKPKLIAFLEGKSYGTTLARVKAGAYGPVIRIDQRSLGVRCGDYRQSVVARQVLNTKTAARRGSPGGRL
jgi:hypothetical protein